MICGKAFYGLLLIAPFTRPCLVGAFPQACREYHCFEIAFPRIFPQKNVTDNLVHPDIVLLSCPGSSNIGGFPIPRNALSPIVYKILSRKSITTARFAEFLIILFEQFELQQFELH